MLLNLTTFARTLFIISPLYLIRQESISFVVSFQLPTTRIFKRAILKKKVDLFLIWKKKPLPRGLFTALVVNLLFQKCSPKFTLSQVDKSQHYNAIRLACTNPEGAVLSIDAIYRLEVLYTCPQNGYYHIHKVIKEGIKAVVEKFHYLDSVKYP